MKDAMIVIAKFNQLQNRKLLALLDGLTDEQRKKDVGTNYTFGSIHGALDRMAGTLAMSLNMLKDDGPGGPDAGTAKYDMEDYEALKAKILETGAAYVAGFEAISEEKCVAGPGVPLYDMVMKGMFIANFVRGAVCQALKAEYGISSDLISGALLS
ncbi:MAG: hypothetical protein PUA87_00180 [Oscillospiraceae bacterium]|nr:hypothetical protein [Oscillospiraceae bacterium]